MSAPVPLVTDTLSAEQWLRLLKVMERFASNQLRLYRWRGLPGGLPPDGFDPPSLASEVIAQLLSGTHCRDALLRSPDDCAELQAHLRRRLWRLVNHLHRRKENHVLSNEPDLPTLLLPDGHVISPVEACLSDDPSPDQILIQKEDHHFRTQLQEKFLASLAADPPLQQLYLQLLAHEAAPQPQPLKLSCRVADNFRKRLRRRFRPFRPLPGAFPPES